MDLEERSTGTAREQEGVMEGTENASFVTDMALLFWMLIDVKDLSIIIVMPRKWGRCGVMLLGGYS